MNSYYTPIIPNSYTKDCKLCGETFTTGNVRNSHEFKYCNDCNAKTAHSRSEKGKAANRAWHLKNYSPVKPKEIECFTCKITISNATNRAKYCNPQCQPAKVKARELREKLRREGKNCQWCKKHISFENASEARLRCFKNVKFCSKICTHHHRLSIPKNALAANFRSEVWKIMKKNPIDGVKNQYDPNAPKGFGVLGYSKEELISHIVAQFKEEMTLENYGEWHIDHIKPVSKFEFEKTSDKEFKECFALENLQPMWAKDNMSKGSKWEEE